MRRRKLKITNTLAFIVVLAMVVFIVSCSAKNKKDEIPTSKNVSSSSSDEKSMTSQKQQTTSESPESSQTLPKAESTTISADDELILNVAANAESPQFNNGILPDYYYINVEPVYQNPELPTGCEITALTTLLNYKGYYVDKLTMCDDFLNIDYNGNSSFYEAFIGDPRSGVGFGCYAPVIADAADKYLKYADSDENAFDMTGTELDELFYYISNDCPVVVWATMSLVPSEDRYCWTTPDGEEVWWHVNEHCMVLTGYDYTNETVTVCDPLKGEMTYSMYAFKERYDELEMQSVIIY